MKIIVCDDEKYICEDLEKRLREYYKSLDVLILSVSSGEELLQMMEREPEEVACIFLDIEMKGMDGLETARRLRAEYPDLPVLLLTSHTELAMEGYEVQAFRFLAKPLQQVKFMEALQAMERSSRAAGRRKLCVPAGDREIYLDCQEIFYIKSENVYLSIVTEQENYLMRGRLKELSVSLPENSFFQIHRSYIVNLSHIRSFDGKNVLMEDGGKLPVSGRRRELFREKITRYLREK